MLEEGKNIDILKIESTRIDIPSIVLNPYTGILQFTGNSVLHETRLFYGPVLEWITQYASAPRSKTIIICKLGYLNSVSKKVFANVLNTFKQLKDPYSVEVNWYYAKDDFDSEELAEEFQQFIKMDHFNIIEFTP